jgi:hypothetical protein
MREFKFRAWDKQEMRFDVFPTSNHTIGKWLGKNELIFHDLGGDKVELMQYTGLIDKNGREIYEGDIVLNNWGETEIVSWLKGKTGFYPFASQKTWSRYFRGHVTLDWEILGNIYEHEHLLTHPPAPGNQSRQ